MIAEFGNLDEVAESLGIETVVRQELPANLPEFTLEDAEEMIADRSRISFFRGLAVFLMLLIGLIITMGIGSSFSTVPLIAAIYVPLCVKLGISPLATVAIVGVAGALGDAGSPVSESVLGPTAGLNADGQHDHIYDSTIPTFIHYNLPLLAAGWIAGMVL